MRAKPLFKLLSERSLGPLRNRSSQFHELATKWEGLLKEGDRAGQTGVLIGETGDIRPRIKQYVSGTQESGNKFWRDQFLTKGDVFLYVLDSAALRSKWSRFESRLSDLSGSNVRLVLEQLRVFREAARGDGARWLVNRKV